MNTTLFYITTVGLIILIIRLLYVAFSPNRKVLKSRINLPYEKLDHNSISSVNKYLDNLEKSIPVYKVKAARAELLDREFNAGTDEERLEKAKKYFKIVHQNFLYKQVNEESISGPTLNTLELYLYRVTIKDGEKEEFVIKKLK